MMHDDWIWVGFQCLDLKVFEWIVDDDICLYTDNDLVEYLSEAFEVAADNCLPDLVSTIQKNIRKAQTSMNCGNGPRLSLVEDIKPQLSAVVQANASRISKTNGKF